MSASHDAPDVRQIAKQARERLEILKIFGWNAPLSRSRLLPKPAGRPSSAAEKLVPATPVRSAPAELTPERVRRESLLLPIREEVAACTRCALCHSRTQTVFGVGDPTARLLFVGEAPGFDEDRLGEPFVGKAGQLLNDIIRAMGLQRSEVYIANVVKCRPPQNRLPDPAEVGSCLGYLERQIEIIAPEVIVALGALSARTLLRTDQSVGRLRNRFHDYRGIPVMPTYHPAYLLRKPEDKKKVWDDVQLVMALLGLKRS